MYTVELEVKALIHSVEYWTPLGQYLVKFVFYNILTEEGLVIRCLHSIKELTVKLACYCFSEVTCILGTRVYTIRTCNPRDIVTKTSLYSTQT